MDLTKFPQIALIIPVYNSWKYTKALINMIKEINYRNYFIVVIDDGSTDETKTSLNDLLGKNDNIIHGDGYWYWTKSINQGIKYSLKKGAEYILLLNNDVIIDPNILHCLLSNSQKLGLSIISPKIEYIDEKGEYYGGKVNKNKGIRRIDKSEISSYLIKNDILKVEELTGMCLFFPKQVIDKIGYFNEISFPQYLSDSEFTIRATKNNINCYVLLNCIIQAFILHSGHRMRKIRLYDFIDSLVSIKSSKNFKMNLKLYRYVFNNSPKVIIILINIYLIHFMSLLVRFIVGNETARKLKKIL